MLPNGLLQMIVSWSLGIVSFLTLCGWGCFRLVVVVREPLVSCSRRGQSSVAVLLPRAPAAPKARRRDLPPKARRRRFERSSPSPLLQPICHPPRPTSPRKSVAHKYIYELLGCVIEHISLPRTHRHIPRYTWRILLHNCDVSECNAMYPQHLKVYM